MALPRYREEFLLGMGGMAEVWRATGPGGPVALKRLLPHAARNPSIAAAFEREGRLLSRIAHPNVIGIHEVARDERGTCLVLEYVEGADLTGMMGQRVAERIALRIIRDLLRALERVHGLCDEEGRPLGLIHRDLSLANVLVDIDGRVKLTDFGLARAVAGSNAATTGLSIKGTLAYLAPEQARGAPVDARADLFATGAILYEILAGAPIYDETDARIALARARAGDVPSLAQVRPDIAPAIVELVDRALATAAADRFPDAATMLRELERVAADTSGLASDQEMAAWARSYMVAVPKCFPPKAEGPTTTVPKRPLPLRIIAVAGSLLVLFFGGWLALRAGTPAPPAAAHAAEAITWEAIEVAAAPGLEVPTTLATPPPPPARTPPPPEANPRIFGERPARKGTHARRTTPSMPPPRTSDQGSKTTEQTSAAARLADDGQKCLLDIGSDPAFAYVSIDGVSVGPTPIFGREVTPGVHRVQVSRDGLGSKSFTLELRPGDRISRVVKLP